MQLVVERIALDTLLKHATSAARRIDDRGDSGDPLVDAVAADIDAIVRELGELLGQAQLSLVRHIVELEAVGWRVVGLRPSRTGDEPALWRVTIERYDENASMTVVEAEPDVALAELVRYTRADAA
ncbi:MAG TPA: hypothetical protein VNO30_24390 [Kofleriaceae bacterium]|nr:hypothetical protein [Kofleriaceae bacterium]